MIDNFLRYRTRLSGEQQTEIMGNLYLDGAPVQAVCYRINQILQRGGYMLEQETKHREMEISCIIRDSDLETATKQKLYERYRVSEPESTASNRGWLNWFWGN